MRSLMVVFGSVAMLFASACVVTSGSSTSGGGGSGGDTTTTTTSANGGNGGGTTVGVGGSGGAGGGAPCQKCAEAIDPMTGNPDLLCKESQAFYDKLAECICNGACAAMCKDNSCAQMDASTECNTCTQDTAAGCGTDFNECANDF